LKILVYEHISGGGFADTSIPTGVLSEGFGMLRTLISDFKAAGHIVTTTLDSRMARLNPPVDADCVVPIFSHIEARETVRKVAESAEAAYVIAPETCQTLRSLVKIVEQTSAVSLNCGASAIDEVADKAVLREALEKLGVAQPKTIILGVLDDVEEIKRAVNAELGFPAIFKPLDGVGCCGLSLVRNEDHVAEAVGKIARGSSAKRFVAQELVKGDAASVSLISTGDEAVAISLNMQKVTVGMPSAVSSYDGGLVPFDNSLKREAFAVAEKIVKFFRGLKGYVGVDMVLTEKEPMVIEVNPRLTTSYVGLRQVLNINLAQAVVNAILKQKVPTSLQTCGYAYFSKVETPNPTSDALQRAYGISELVSPPFPVSDNGATCALLSSHGATSKEAAANFREAKKRFQSTMSRA
jgi:predicted ATP-grasp superfamily ATP-dependent carboligase